jgi:ribosomal protein S19
MHVESYEHFVESDRSNKTCQSCHMMEGEMIIHNMPIYSGDVGFEVNKTADMIGLGLGGATFFSITMNVIARRGSRRPKVKIKPVNARQAGGDEDEK